MYSILGRGSFCFNYCLNSAWHGGDQFVALLRWYGSPGFFDSGLQLICIFGSLVSHLPLDNTPYILYGVQVWWVSGQSSTPTPWSFKQLLVLLWAGAKSCWKIKSASLKSWSAEESGVAESLTLFSNDWFNLIFRLILIWIYLLI